MRGGGCGLLADGFFTLSGLGWFCSHTSCSWAVLAGVYGLVPQADFLISLKGMVQVRAHPSAVRICVRSLALPVERLRASIVEDR